MKRFVILSCLLGITFLTFSQEELNKRSIATSVSGDYMTFQLMNSSSQMDSYETLNTNTSFDCTIDINIPILKKSEFSTGIGINYRFGEAEKLNINDVRVSEYFLRVPVSFKYFLFDEGSLVPFIGIGAYLDVLAEQNYYFKDDLTIPVGFNESYGFGKYLKPGISTNIGFRFRLQDRIGLDFGMKGSFDIAELFINSENIDTYDYSAYGLYFSILFL